MSIKPAATNPRRAQLANEYAAKIGYDPFVDDPAITDAEVEQTIREWDAINASEAA